MASDSVDRAWMQRALVAARKGWGRTSPNPMVGAVVVQNDRLVGVGWHRRAGGPHAEVEALQAAHGKTRGASLYVTLEPCSTFGRTPPCTDAILQSGIARVVIATADPNPRHNGAGVERLRAGGIAVDIGVLEEKCAGLNEAFFHWIVHQRPFVLLKLAMTLDGKIATRTGESKWISCAASRRRVQKLRQWADAVMVGANTIRRDNPGLLVRSPAKWPRQPLRLVASRSGNLGPNPEVLTDDRGPGRIIACKDRDAWTVLFADLGKQGISSLLVEGGGTLAGELIRHQLVNKVLFFVAPKIMGGQGSVTAVGGTDPATLGDACDLGNLGIERCGTDIVITGYPNHVHGLH